MCHGGVLHTKEKDRHWKCFLAQSPIQILPVLPDSAATAMGQPGSSHPLQQMSDENVSPTGARLPCSFISCRCCARKQNMICRFCLSFSLDPPCLAPPKATQFIRVNTRPTISARPCDPISGELSQSEAFSKAGLSYVIGFVGLCALRRGVTVALCSHWRRTSKKNGRTRNEDQG
jgi:hypothetical protein